MTSSDQSENPSKLMQIFAETAGTYKRGSFDYKKNLILLLTCF